MGWQAQLTVGSACGWWWTALPDHPQHSLSHWRLPDSLIFAQDSEHVWHLQLLFVWRVYRLLFFKDPLPTGILTRAVSHHLGLPPAGNSPTKGSTFLSCPFLLLFLLFLSLRKSPNSHIKRNSALSTRQWWLRKPWLDNRRWSWLLIVTADARICSPAVMLILLTFSGGWRGAFSDLLSF